MDGSYRAWLAATAANRVRGIVKFDLDLDHGRGFWRRNPGHGFAVIEFRAGHIFDVVAHVVGERQGDALDLGS